MQKQKINLQALPEKSSQQSIGKSILLHISPGLLTTAGLLGIKPLMDRAGLPPLMAFLAAVLLIDIPFMLGLMLVEGKKINGKLSLNGIVHYRIKTTWKTFSLIFIGGFILLYLVITLSAPITAVITEKAFSWMPGWFFFDEFSLYEDFNKNILIFVFSLQLVVTGILLPWVEELYFRGYLLPKISRYRGWAPLIGGLLFGFYHSWQLYDWVAVSLLGIGLAYIVWWKRDIRLGISLHVFANAIIRIMLLIQVFTM